MSIPKIGSAEFKLLPFKEQLEIVSLKLFEPDHYAGVLAQPHRTSSGLHWSLNYPLTPDVEVVDLPVAVLKDYWAGYSCYFSEKWYAGEYRGMSPLDDFGIQYDKMASIWTFTFPLLSVESSIYSVIAWMLRNLPEQTAPSMLLRACKVYLYLDSYLRDPEKFASFRISEIPEVKPSALVFEAFKLYREIFNFTRLNFYYPIVEECHEVTWLEHRELVMHLSPRKKGGRWFYPLIPSALFTAPSFRILTWQFLR